MSCGYSKEILALYIEDDLPTLDARTTVESHVTRCADCRKYCDGLSKNQAFIRSRFKAAHPDSVSQDMLTGVRRSVMSQIDLSGHSLGWAVRLERFLLLGMKRPRYAAVAFAVVAVVSASLLGQMPYSQRLQPSAAVFAANNVLLCPTDYREWVFAGSCVGHEHAVNVPSDSFHNVYIDPAAYRQYKRSGQFPEGTVMVLETLSAEMKQEPGLHGSYEKDFKGLEVSVKDSSRFDGGWGFYDFTRDPGKLKPEAEALPQTAGCVSCHRDRAATDHVFTQFYPVFRSSTAKL